LPLIAILGIQLERRRYRPASGLAGA